MRSFSRVHVRHRLRKCFSCRSGNGFLRRSAVVRDSWIVPGPIPTEELYDCPTNLRGSLLLGAGFPKSSRYTGLQFWGSSYNMKLF